MRRALDKYRDPDFLDSYTAERYAAELPDSLLRSLADTEAVPEHELAGEPARYADKGKGRKSRNCNVPRVVLPS